MKRSEKAQQKPSPQMLKGGLGRALRSEIIGKVEGSGKRLRLKMAAKMRPDSGTGKDSVSERIVAGWNLKGVGKDSVTETIVAGVRGVSLGQGRRGGVTGGQ